MADDELLALDPPQAAEASVTRPASEGDDESRRHAGKRSLPGLVMSLISCRAMSEDDAFGRPADDHGARAPGLRIRESLGVCYGLVVRSMGFTGGFTASFKALRRGEITEYTQLLEDSRRHAIDRMVDNARLIGAEAIVAVRFDSSEIGQQFTEIVAYGTAVTVTSASGPG